MSLSNRQLFQAHLAQTTDFPMQLEIERAEGIYVYDPQGKAYLDLISGISVSNVGHRHPKVVEAIKRQLDKYMHLMVYGEYVQSPQVKLAEKLAHLSGGKLDNAYLVNSGSEAIEGAMKLAKRATGRREIIAMKSAYHGSTHGALSIIGDESFKNAYRPLLPETRQLIFNNFDQLSFITERTAAVFVEPVQGEAGYVPADPKWLKALAKRCKQVGALLVLDEIQSGIGRTGSFFAFQQYGVEPDILCLAKGLGGGMPIGAFLSKKALMDHLKVNPILGHITTFGGHPLSAAAAVATLKVIEEQSLLTQVKEKSERFKKKLQHPKIREVRGMGLMLALQLDSFDQVQRCIQHCLERGLISDWFLFCDNAIRISPPLTIEIDQIDEACAILVENVEKS